MKTFEIKITGSGTKNQIEVALIDLVRDLQGREEEEITGEYEDPIICTEIKE
jgi:hypothetical protein